MLLFDTSVLIPWLAGEPLPQSFVERVCVDGAYVSPVSIWEIWIKAGIGKLEVQTDSLVREVEATQLTWLPVLPSHADAIRDLPRLHRDPFDRLLIAQAKVEHLTVVTTDKIFSNYLSNTWLIP